MGAPIDLTGKIFGRLTVIGLSTRRRGTERCWDCECTCGTARTVAGSELRTGQTKSCGCLHLERAAKLGRTNTKHGAARMHAESPEYRTWVEMRRRCTNPNFIGYARYGGRGITVCERWDSFATFLADMGPKPTPRHSIDREDNDGNYEPGNCRWATAKEQANTRSNSR